MPLSYGLQILIKKLISLSVNVISCHTNKAISTFCCEFCLWVIAKCFCYLSFFDDFLSNWNSLNAQYPYGQI